MPDIRWSYVSTPAYGEPVTHTAFLGLGRMGAPMARRLLDAGHELTVFNRTAACTELLVAAGAKAARTPAEAVAGADLVITMLADPAAVDAVLFRPDGAVRGLRDGCTLVEMSTIGPDAVRSVAERLPVGVALVDAPAMGSTPRAEAGELLILAGGEPAPPVEEALNTLGTVVRCGPLGSGAALKVVHISAIITAVTVVGEALAVAEALGVERDGALRALGGGPLAGVTARATDTESRFGLALAAKDLALAEAAAPGGGLTLTAAARAHLLAAAESAGADADLSAVVGHLRAAAV
jgi:3-hydroxyisobutyrate dehydrogenase-like beta-hydroxyacid dehydrogenase